jgi:inward rectifier potassium channel
MSEPTATTPAPRTTAPEQVKAAAPPRVAIEIRGLQRKPWRDVYPFLLATTWPRLLSMIAVLYLAFNALFGAIYYYGDPGGIENADPHSYLDNFFFSIQTWATIGYGKLVPVHLFSHIIVTIESFLGMLSVAMITGLLFAKFSRPNARVVFSKVAVVTTWDGQRSLLFRLANERGTQIVDAQMTVTLNRVETTADGGSVRRFLDLKLTRNKNPNFLFAWTVIHPIDETSPLFHLTMEELTRGDSIIGVSLVGIDEVFNQTVYARYSYTPADVRWGHDFMPILSRGEQGQRVIDYSHFHDTEPEDSEDDADGSGSRSGTDKQLARS